MKSKKIYTIIFSLIAAVIVFGFLWSWYVTKDIGTDVDKAARNDQRVTVSNLMLTETKNAKKYWELYASKGHYESGSQKAQLEDIMGNFYNDNEEVILSLQASEGIYNQEDKTIELKGNVLAVSKDGSSILADEMIWMGQNEDIVAKGNVKINKNNQLVTKSEKAIFNSELTYFRIEGKSESKVYEKMEGE